MIQRNGAYDDSDSRDYLPPPIGNRYRQGYEPSPSRRPNSHNTLLERDGSVKSSWRPDAVPEAYRDVIAAGGVGPKPNVPDAATDPGNAERLKQICDQRFPRGPHSWNSSAWDELCRDCSDYWHYLRGNQRVAAEAVRDVADFVASWIEDAGQFAADVTGVPLAAAPAGYYGAMYRQLAEFAAGIVDPITTVECTIGDVEQSVEFGKKHGFLLGLYRQIGIIQIVESLGGVDIDKGRFLTEAERWQRASEGFGRIGATAAMLAGLGGLWKRCCGRKKPPAPTPKPKKKPAGTGPKPKSGVQSGKGGAPGGLTGSISSRVAASGAHISDDALVNFGSLARKTVNPSTGPRSFWFRYGDIKHLSPKQLQAVIGDIASAGQPGGASVMRVGGGSASAFTKKPPTTKFFDIPEYTIDSPVRVSASIPIGE